jgi:hypothetical protein
MTSAGTSFPEHRSFERMSPQHRGG